MFKGKVQVYQNVNGQEKTVSKDFDNYDDYASFLDTNRSLFQDVSLGSYGWFGQGFRDLESLLDRYFNTRLGLAHPTETSLISDPQVPIDLGYYEAESRKLELEAKEKEAKKSSLEKAKLTVLGYLDNFKKHQDPTKVSHLIERAENDLKTIEEELSKLS